MSMESAHMKGTIEHERSYPEAGNEDSKVLLEANTRAFSSASSASSSSSSRASLEFDVGDKSPFDDSTVLSKSDGDLLCGQESVPSPDFTGQTPQWSMMSASSHVGMDMVSPPVQTMDYAASYDPNRIPASIFSTKAANASDWSIASNDSLFSIHMGNNSFSRDLLLWKSGELARLDECSNSQSPCVSEARYSELSSLTPVIEVPAHEEGSTKSSNASRLDNQGSSNSLKAAPEANKGAPPAETTRILSSNPRVSEASACSSSSFAFPVLVSDGAETGSLEGGKEKPEESELQTQDSKATDQQSLMSRWFSWSSCLPRCC